MTYSLIADLTESRMFPSKKSFEHQDFESLTEGAYLLLITARILLTEDVTFAMKYLKKVISTSSFKTWRADSNDLYLHCFGLTTGAYEAVGKEPETVSMVAVMRWMREMVQSKGLKEDETNRFFLRMDRLLHINDASMRAVRRLVMDWPDLDEHEKRLSCTRLLQMMRSRMPKSDLLPILQKLVRENDWELKGVCDRETGEGCDDDEKPARKASGYRDPHKRDKGGIIASLAGAGVGFAAGYAMTRKHKSVRESDGGTSSANVATAVQPLGAKKTLGPGFGGTDKGIYAKREEAAMVLRRPAPTTIVVEEPAVYPTPWMPREVRNHAGLISWQVFREAAPKDGKRIGEAITVNFESKDEAEAKAARLNEGEVDARYARIRL